MFELPKFQDQNRWPVAWTTQDQRCLSINWIFQDSRLKPLISCLICPRLKTKTEGQFFDLQSTKLVASRLNFARLENKTVEQLFELPWLKSKTVGQLFELPKTKSVEQLLNYSTPKCWAVVCTSQESRTKPLRTWLNFSIAELKMIGQLFEIPKTVDQIHWAVVWTSQVSRPKTLASCLNHARPKVFVNCLNFPRLDTKTVHKLFDLSKTQDQNSGAVFWSSKPKIDGQ